jgi:hypothetical protein
MHGLINLEMKKLSVIFGLVDDPDKTVMGMCTSYRDGERLVEIRKEPYESMNSYDKEQLLFHELAHCTSLNRPHCEVVEDGIPVSVMYPNMLESELYEDNRDEYIEELFHADQRCK